MVIKLCSEVLVSYPSGLFMHQKTLPWKMLYPHKMIFKHFHVRHYLATRPLSKVLPSRENRRWKQESIIVVEFLGIIYHRIKSLLIKRSRTLCVSRSLTVFCAFATLPSEKLCPEVTSCLSQIWIQQNLSCNSAVSLSLSKQFFELVLMKSCNWSRLKLQIYRSLNGKMRSLWNGDEIYMRNLGQEIMRWKRISQHTRTSQERVRREVTVMYHTESYIYRTKFNLLKKLAFTNVKHEG